MLSRDHPPFQDRRAGSGIPGLAGLPTHPGGVAERPMDRTRSRDDGGSRVEVWLPAA
jgi:hypothetical protein